MRKTTTTTEGPDRRVYRDDQITAMKEKGFWPIPEVAALLKMSPSTIYRWVNDKKVEGMWAGPARYVKLSSVRSYLGEAASEALAV